jgi:glycosyltransferase involved in cell wall biosynthesis
LKGVSIIICCYNSASRIIPTLNCLKNQQNYEGINWEILLIDNNSTDDTATIAKKTWENHPNNIELRIINEKKIGQAFARNTGIENSKYEIISFIDDDNWVPENWIKVIFEKFETHTNLGVLGCNIKGNFEKTPPKWLEPLLIAYAIGKLYDAENVTKLGPVYGAGMCVRKAALENLKKRGWVPYLSGRSKEVLLGGDDSEICFAIRQIGYEIHYDKNLTLTHFVPANRLEKSYTLKLCEGFGNADMVLLAYKIAYALKTKAEANWLLFLKRQWWVQSMICLKRIIFDQKSWPFATSTDPIKVKLDAFLRNLWQEKNKLSTMVTEITNL